MKAAGVATLALVLAPAPLAAQGTPDFSLPGTRPTTNPRAQGPVDPDNPVIRAAPRPAPSPPPSPAATAPSPAPTSTPTAAGPRPAATATPRPATGTATRPALPAATPAAQGSQATSPAVTPGAEAALPAATDAAPLPLPSASAPDSFAQPALTGDSVAAPGWYWPWIAGITALLAALFAFLWWRRRKPAPALLEFERPIVPAQQAAPGAQAEPMAPPPPDPTPAPAPAPQPEPEPAAAPGGLAISLEARRMSASLMATTLNYVLKITNTSQQPLSALAVEGDMIAAHASLPPEQQIAHDSQRLELRHAMVTLEPGESAEFTGDFRLPLASLVPIRAGDAALFIPLARLRVEASTAAGTPLVQVRTYVVGELPEQGGAALRPFRLDLGPRTYSRLGQRAVN